MGFEVAQDAPYGEERWLAVSPPDQAVNLVLDLRGEGSNDPAEAPEALPTSNVMFRRGDLQATYEELSARGVEFPGHRSSSRSGGGRCSATPKATASPRADGALTRRERRGQLHRRARLSQPQGPPYLVATLRTTGRLTRDVGLSSHQVKKASSAFRSPGCSQTSTTRPSRRWSTIASRSSSGTRPSRSARVVCSTTA